MTTQPQKSEMNPSHSQPRAAGEAAHPARSQLLSHSHVYMMDGINSHGERCTAVYSRLEIERACNSHAELLAENAALRDALAEMVGQFGHYCEHTEDPAEVAALNRARSTLRNEVRT